MSDAPVTHAELQTALAPIHGALAGHGDAITELRQELAVTRTELTKKIADTRTELRQEIADTRTELTKKIDDTRAELSHRITETRDELIRHIGEAAAHVANVIAESTRSQIAALDDKYRDTPRGVETLRGELETHVAGRAVHVKPAPPRPRARARRTRRS